MRNIFKLIGIKKDKIMIKRISDTTNGLNPKAKVPEAKALIKLNTNIITKSSILKILTL